MRKIALAIFIFMSVVSSSVYAGVTIKEQLSLPPTPMVENSDVFPIFDKVGKPLLLFEPRPAIGSNMMCKADDKEIRYYAVYPHIFFIPCPKRVLTAKNEKNNVKWAVDLTPYNGGQIGYSKDGIIVHSFDQYRLDILDIETGVVIEKLSTKILKCQGYPRSALYTKNDNSLYVFCSEGELKKADLNTQIVTSVLSTHKQFLSQVPTSLSNMKIDSSGRFLIFSQTMGSRMNSWGGVGVYDLLDQEMVFSKKIYQTSWDVNIAVGIQSDFFVQYLCYKNKAYNVCGEYYTIQTK